MPGYVQITVNVAKVLQVFLMAPATPRYGYELMRRLGFTSGRLYPILTRLENAEWITGHREAIDPVTAGRPPRRYYVLNPGGVWLAGQALAKLRAALDMLPTPDPADRAQE